MTIFDEIRAGAQAVSAQARSVQIDEEKLRQLADALLPELGSAASNDDAAHLRLFSEADTVAYVVTLDAVNFGSPKDRVIERSRRLCVGASNAMARSLPTSSPGSEPRTARNSSVKIQTTPRRPS